MKFTSGPIEVLTDAGARAGRETMVRFQEFRHALGQLVGEQDLQTPLPVRILVFKNAKGWTSLPPVSEGRDRYAIVLQEKGAVTPAIYRELTRLFLKSNTAQMPPAFEHGLVAFFSTFEVNGIRITAGAPPAKPDLDWARIHLLVADPDYFGKLRVLLYNLRHGVADDPAYRNAFGKSAQRWKPKPRSTSPPGISRPRRFPAAPWRKATSRRSRSPKPMCGWRAPTCWRAANRRPSTKACFATASSRSRGRARAAGARRPSQRRSPPPFRGRHGSRQQQRTLLHRVRQAGT